MEEPIRMTDKRETKILPCSYPGCGKQLIVNKFESKARARCPEHKGKTVPTFGSVERADTLGINGALGELGCPFHPDVGMKLIRVKEGVGFMTFKCYECSTAVEIMPNFGPSIIPHCPEDLKPLMHAFNDGRGGVRPSDQLGESK